MFFSFFFVRWAYEILNSLYYIYGRGGRGYRGVEECNDSAQLL